DSLFLIKILNDNRVKFDEKYVKINITSILKKNDYSSNYNRYSISQVKSFIEANKEIFNECSKIYGIPKEVIASILWIETKNGSYLGTHNIVSVFFSASMSEEPEFIQMNFEAFRESEEYKDKDSSLIMDLVTARASKKANWAIEELLALEKMYKEYNINILNLNGSWAGAFGYSQFLPSSFINYSVDGDNDGVINLFSLKDAIFSIANYLKENGWKDTYESQNKAVYAYNNSKEYVQAVMTLYHKVALNDTASFFIIPERIIITDSL
ncbi:MAG: lytic murein transglycosylase, partial [Candidatus Woesearchaeota archaeon]